MDPINRLNRLMETLRQRMAESTKRSNRSSSTQQTRLTRASSAPSGRSIEQLRQHIGERVRAIKPEMPEHGRQARRVFFESVLAWEFGDQLLLDNQFSRLIDGIQEAFEADPEIDHELHELLVDLSRE